MTAPDPLECLALRMVNDERLCNALESEHCEKCQMCPGCACPPATEWKKGDRVRITFDAVYYAEPSHKPDQYALVVLPGTNLDDNPLILNRFRVPLTAMTRVDTTGARTWRQDDAEPDGVKTVLSETYGLVWTRSNEGTWVTKTFGLGHRKTWPQLLQKYGSVTEVENLKHSKETS